MRAARARNGGADLVCFVVFIVSWVATGLLYMMMCVIAVPKGYPARNCRNVCFFRELIRNEPDAATRTRYKRILQRFTIAEIIAVASSILMILLQVLPQMLRRH